MDEAHTLAAIRYIALNPVRAKLVRRARDWRWASTRALLDPERGDGITDTEAVLARVSDFAALITSEEDERTERLRLSENTGRPLGGQAFLDQVQAITGVDPRPMKRGRKRNSCNSVTVH
ncbi:MAG: hypothetical protein AAGK17_09485 [Pseudomonadota bacterium]